MSDRDETIIKLINSLDRADNVIGIEMLFTVYPSIREYQKPIGHENQMAVYFEDIEHIIDFGGKLIYSGAITPETLKIDEYVQ